MKTRLIILAVGFAGGLSLGLFRASAELEVSAGISINSAAEFNEPLAPHGSWAAVGSYGQCWHPTGVAADWRPYCDGSWEWTDCGWYWVSDEPWAWACYHYGSWIDDPNAGWCWVPGVEWAPAWVTWRTGGDYIGWSPCGPPGFVVAPAAFVFVEGRNFSGHIRPENVIVNNTVIINKTTVIGPAHRESRQFDGRTQEVMVNEGPRVDAVEKATGKKFAATPVRNVDQRTAGSIPETIKRRTAEPVNSQKPAPIINAKPPAVQGHPAPAPDRKSIIIKGGNSEMPHNIPPNNETPSPKIIPPDRTIPQPPPEKIPQDKMIPPPNKERPLDKDQRPPKEIVRPQQPVSPPPVPPRENNQGDDNKKNDKPN